MLLPASPDWLFEASGALESFCTVSPEEEEEEVSSLDKQTTRGDPINDKMDGSELNTVPFPACLPRFRGSFLGAELHENSNGTNCE